MTKTIFGKAWALMILALAVVEAIFLGSYLALKDWEGAITTGILLVFWLFAVGWFHIAALREQESDLEFEKTKKDVDDKLGKLIGELKEKMEEELAPRQDFVDSFKEATGVDFFEAKTVTTKQKLAIEKLYHEKTGRYARITPKNDGVIGAELSDRPFKKAPVKKKTVTTKKGK